MRLFWKRYLPGYGEITSEDINAVLVLNPKRSKKASEFKGGIAHGSPFMCRCGFSREIEDSCTISHTINSARFATVFFEESRGDSVRTQPKQLVHSVREMWIR